MYLNEQIPMVCLGCLENKYFPRDLIFGLSKKPTEPRGTDAMGQRWRVPGCGARWPGAKSSMQNTNIPLRVRICGCRIQYVLHIYVHVV